jgi:hypothetical protein
LRREGIEDAGRRAGREKAWMDVNVLEAYGSCDVGPETARRGWIFGYDLGERGDVEKWWTSGAVVSAERKEEDARYIR